MYVEYIQSILLIIAAILIIISAIGVVSLNRNMKNVVYARIHIIGVFDIACILAMIGIGQYLLAGIYFILAPFTAHTLAYAFFKSEDSLNNKDVEKRIEKEAETIESPFIHSKEEIQELERNKFEISDKSDDSFSVIALDISEDD